MAIPKKFPKKGTKLQQNYGVTNEDINRTVAVKHTIDTNKRTKPFEEPRFTD